MTGGHFSLSRDFLGARRGGRLPRSPGSSPGAPPRDSEPILGGIIAPVAVAVAILAFVAAFVLVRAAPTLTEWTVAIAAMATLVCAAIAVIAGDCRDPARARTSRRPACRPRSGSASRASVLLMLVLSANFGLAPVETPLWGGLLVTLVVAIVGIVDVAAARHPAGARTPLAHAVRAGRLDRLHRVHPRRAADHGPLHGERDAAGLPAAGRQLRQAAPGTDRRRAVLRGLHGGGRPRRPAGHPARAVRGGPGDRA